MKDSQRKAIHAKSKYTTAKEYIHYHSETKAKADANRKHFETDGVKIAPPYKTEGKVPHHGNNHTYWTVKRPVTWGGK